LHVPCIGEAPAVPGAVNFREITRPLLLEQGPVSQPL
jgi:hypothetical protein